MSADDGALRDVVAVTRATIARTLREVLDKTEEIGTTMAGTFESLQIDPIKWIALPHDERATRLAAALKQVKSPLVRVRKQAYGQAFAKLAYLADAEWFAAAADITVFIERLQAEHKVSAEGRIPVVRHYQIWLDVFSKTKEALDDGEAAGRYSGEDNVYRRLVINDRLRVFSLNYAAGEGVTNLFDVFESFQRLLIERALTTPPGRPLPP